MKKKSFDEIMNEVSAQKRWNYEFVFGKGLELNMVISAYEPRRKEIISFKIDSETAGELACLFDSYAKTAIAAKGKKGYGICGGATEYLKGKEAEKYLKAEAVVKAEVDKREAEFMARMAKAREERLKREIEEVCSEPVEKKKDPKLVAKKESKKPVAVRPVEKKEDPKPVAKKTIAKPKKK